MNGVNNNIAGKQAGGIMLLVLMLLIVFIAIMSATLRFIIRQSHETVDQEQEEQAFNAADAGVSYVLWMLDPDGLNYSTAEVEAVEPINRAVTDDLDQPIGTFTVNNIRANTGVIAFSSVGQDQELTNRCQVIAVELRQREAGAQYIVTDWDHQVGYPCP